MRKEYETPEVKVCYFGVREDGVNALRLRIQYTADEWLFFKKVNFWTNLTYSADNSRLFVLLY